MKPDAGKYRNLRRLFRCLRDRKAAAAAVFLSALAGTAANLAAPASVGRALDLMTGPGAVASEALRKPLATLVFVYVLSAAAQCVGSLISIRLAAHVSARLREEAFERLSSLPLSVLDRQKRGDLIARFVGDAENVADGVNQFFTQFFTAAVTVPTALFFMLRLNPILTAAVVVCTPLIFAVARAVSRNTAKHFRRTRALLGDLSAFADERVRGLRTLKAYAAEEPARAEFARINAELYEAGQKSQFFSSLTNPCTRFVNHVSYVTVGLVGGVWAVLYGLPVGTVAAFLTYSSLWAKPFNEFSAVTGRLMSALASLNRIGDFLDLPPSSEEAAEAEPQIERSVRGEIEFRNVSFSYDKARPLICDLSFRVPAGSTVAVVGPTGAGKTTLVNLLMKFYEPDSGAVLLDGTDIRDIPAPRLRRAFGMVLQDTWLFGGTVHDNIAYGVPGADRRQVIAAAKAVGAHGFIRRLPKGYDTVLTDSGANLSQGQRQLLTLARVMLLNPPMLILDEATGNVDVLTEQKILKAFRKLTEGRTCFVIAHRLSTVRHADRILVMKDGAVVEQGTHEELIRKGGFYKELRFAGLEEVAG